MNVLLYALHFHRALVDCPINLYLAECTEAPTLRFKKLCLGEGGYHGRYDSGESVHFAENRMI